MSLPASDTAMCLSLTVPAEAHHLPFVRRTARDFAERHDVEQPPDVALAVCEACANVVTHAYVDRTPGPLHVSGFLDDRLVILAVADEGHGFAFPHAASFGLGLGPPIIAALTELRGDHGARADRNGDHDGLRARSRFRDDGERH